MESNDRSATDYAIAKGRALPHEASVVSHKKISDLSEAEKGQIARNKAFVLSNIPIAAEQIRQLFDLGMVDGWRCIVECHSFEDKTDEER